MDDDYEPDFEETKEYELTVAIGHLDEWMMDIESGDAIEDFPQVPLMQYIIGTLRQLLPTWRKSLEYDLRVEQVGKEQAFYEVMQQQFGLDLQEEEE